MKKVIIALLIVATAVGIWYGWEHKEKVLEAIPGLESSTHILTFETATTAEELMQKHQKELLKDGDHSYGKTVVRFLPCLLFQVKYTKDDKKTEVGDLLFSLEDGEMILNTQTFEMTHGFEDCLAAHADAEDFKLLHVLHIKGGAISKEALSHELGMQAEQLFQRLETLRKKHLVAIRGDMIRIHLPTPLLKVAPESDIRHPIVSKVAPKGSRFPPRYSKGEIKHLIKSAFGPDFAIRSEEMVFVPIFQINVQNPDGSVMKTYWNGLTGKRVQLQNKMSG